MRHYLEKPNSAFYHVTFEANWKQIQRDGVLKANEGKIFVLRSNKKEVIFSMATGQLPDFYNHNKLVLLKIPQNKNNFKADEIGIDEQSNEPTMPIQNIVYRKDIPIANIELDKTIKYDVNDATIEAEKFDCNKDSFECFRESFHLIYEINGKKKKLVRQYNHGIDSYYLQ